LSEEKLDLLEEARIWLDEEVGLAQPVPQEVQRLLQALAAGTHVGEDRGRATAQPSRTVYEHAACPPPLADEPADGFDVLVELWIGIGQLQMVVAEVAPVPAGDLARAI